VLPNLPLRLRFRRHPAARTWRQYRSRERWACSPRAWEEHCWPPGEGEGKIRGRRAVVRRQSSTTPPCGLLPTALCLLPTNEDTPAGCRSGWTRSAILNRRPHPPALRDRDLGPVAAASFFLAGRFVDADPCGVIGSLQEVSVSRTGKAIDNAENLAATQISSGCRCWVPLVKTGLVSSPERAVRGTSIACSAPHRVFLRAAR
jgi:hypothetical protein